MKIKECILLIIFIIFISIIFYVAIRDINKKTEEQFKIKKIEYEQHKYLIFQRYNGVGVAHDPKCLKCLKRE